MRADAGASRAKLEGWIQLKNATDLFKAAGLDIDKLRAAANKPGFKAVPMTGLKAIGDDHRSRSSSRTRAT